MLCCCSPAPSSPAPRSCPASPCLAPHREDPARTRAARCSTLPPADLVLVDGRQDLAARPRPVPADPHDRQPTPPCCSSSPRAGSPSSPIDWATDDVVLHTCGPAELDARIRLAIGRAQGAARAPDDPSSRTSSGRGEVVVDDATYTAQHRRPLARPDATRSSSSSSTSPSTPAASSAAQQLLHEVWGYDYFGGTRTVDVHVRRLRAKLGTEHERRIGTVRNVGYRFVVPTARGIVGADERLRGRRPTRLPRSGLGSRHGRASPRSPASPTPAEAADGTSPSTRRPGIAPRGRRSDRSPSSAAASRFVHDGVARPGGAPGRSAGTALGSALLQRVASYDGELVAWSHGDHPAAARARGDVPAAERVARPLGDAAADASLPLPPRRAADGLTIRSYADADADAVAGASTPAAFAQPPRAGRDGSRPTSRARMAEPWFDPAGTAGRGGRRPACSASTGPTQHDAEHGEVYVVGVAPAGPGPRARPSCSPSPACTTSPDSASARSCSYVEADNAPALAVYSRLGFEHADDGHPRPVPPPLHLTPVPADDPVGERTDPTDQTRQILSMAQASGRAERADVQPHLGVDDDLLGGGHVVHASAPASTGTLRLTSASAIGPSHVVARARAADAADDACRRGCTGEPRSRRQPVLRAVEVQQHQPPGRAAERVHPGHRLLTAVAALLQVHCRVEPGQLVGDCPVVGLVVQARPPGRDPQRLEGPHARRPGRPRRRTPRAGRGAPRSYVGLPAR